MALYFSAGNASKGTFMRGKPRRLVVKVGTSTLTLESGALNLRRLDLLARALSDIKNMGCEVILVSSGAIGVGVSELRLPERPTELRLKQAAAAVGQCELMHIYAKFFGEYGHRVGQILLTSEDVAHPARRENLQNTFEALLELGAIPVVNENDSVSFDEIESGTLRAFGDNDTLSAAVAVLTGADLLVLLSDIDGLFDHDPHEDTGAVLIPLVRELTQEILELAGRAGSSRGTGGMRSKLSAANLVMENGIDMIIASGEDPGILYDVYDGKKTGTLFTVREE